MIGDSERIMILMDHLIGLVEQVRVLAEIVRKSGFDVPREIGTLGPATKEVIARHTRESIKRGLASGTIAPEIVRKYRHDLDLGTDETLLVDDEG